MHRFLMLLPSGQIRCDDVRAMSISILERTIKVGGCGLVQWVWFCAFVCIGVRGLVLWSPDCTLLSANVLFLTPRILRSIALGIQLKGTLLAPR